MAVDGVRPRADRMAGDDAAAQLRRRSRRARSGSAAANATSRSASASASRGGNESSQRQAGEELFQRRVAGEHRHLAGGGLVDDLVERLAPARLGRAQERIGPREQRRELVARERRLDPDPVAQLGQRQRSAPALRVRALVVGQLRPSDLELRVAAAATRQHERLEHRVVALPARRAAEGEQAQRPVGPLGRAGANCSTSMACPVAWSFGVSIGNEPAADAHHDVDQREREPQRAARVPVRVPEQHRDPQRLHERRRQEREERNHMDQHGARTRRPGSQSRRGRAKREPARRRATRAPNVRSRTFAGRSWRPTASQSTSTASQRARQLAHDVHRLREHGVVGVDLLGDERGAARSAGGAGDRRVDQRPHLARELFRRRVPVGVPRPGGRPHPLGELAVAEHAGEGGRERDRCRPGARAGLRPRA